jgi:hypothetical protein
MAAKSRRRLWIGLAAAAAVAVGIAMRLGGLWLTPYSWRCQTDDDIAPEERAAISRAAADFAERVMGPDPASAHAMLATSVRAGMTAEQLQADYRRQQESGPFGNWTVSHVYVAKLDGATDIVQAVCGRISRPDDQVAVAVKPGPAQAHVLVEGTGPHGTAALALWMVKEDGTWRLLESHLRAAAYMGKTAVDFEELAKAEERDRHLLNAALLYVEAVALADRGPRMQLGIFPRIAREVRAVNVPGPLAGDPPFTWNAGGAPFKVLHVEPTGLDDGHGHDKLWVVVVHEIEPWVDEPFAERRNQELLAAFRKTYPSYRRQFAGVVVRGQEKDHDGGGVRGWGTVHTDDGAADGDAAASSSSGADPAP